MLPGVGVFGTSLTARVIIPLLKDEGFAVKALWGRTQEEAEELAKEMSVPFYTSRIDEVLLHQDVDLVCINLPPPLTRQIAVKTLELGHQRKKSSRQKNIGGKMPRGFVQLSFCSLQHPHVGHLFTPDAALGESRGTSFKPLGMQPV
uniref:Gfo/Idh/MocA-like oxidoreductase domain containing 1 n=1 Tax=Callithrix jacchus TaxID=9483 RepID=A0A2R8PI13_CALJA